MAPAGHLARRRQIGWRIQHSPGRIDDLQRLLVAAQPGGVYCGSGETGDSEALDFSDLKARQRGRMSVRPGADMAAARAVVSDMDLGQQAPRHRQAPQQRRRAMAEYGVIVEKRHRRPNQCAVPSFGRIRIEVQRISAVTDAAELSGSDLRADGVFVMTLLDEVSESVCGAHAQEDW